MDNVKTMKRIQTGVEKMNSRNLLINKWFLAACVIIAGMAAIPILACPDQPEPITYEPDEGSYTITDPNDPNSVPLPIEGQTGSDPVLLSTGEFLLTRHETSISTGDFVFPLIRTYRGKPAPVTEQVGRYAGGKVWSDWCIITWEEPPDDPYYPIVIQFTITPVGCTGGYEEASVAQAYADMDIHKFLPIETGRDGTAFRFELGTGNEYQLDFVVKRKFPSYWTWSGEWVAHYGFEPWQTIYTWSDTVNIPEWQTNQYPVAVARSSCPLSRGGNITVSEYEDLAKRPGWDMSFNIFLRDYPDPNEYDEVDGRVIVLNTGDGNRYRYTPDPVSNPEVWRCSSRNDFLKKYSWGYILYQKHNVHWYFSTAGGIIWISKNGKVVVNFAYSNGYGLNGDVPRLVQIRSKYVRQLDLIYENDGGIYPGNLSKIVDHTGRTWQYDYYSDGNLKSVTDPNGYKETYMYTSDGALEIIKDNDNNVWLENDYDSQGRVYQQTLGGTGGPVSSIAYNSGNRVVTDANGIDRTYVLNDDGYTTSMVQETDDDSVTTAYQRNSRNQLTKITYPEDNGYDLVYDDNGNLTSVAAFSSDSNDPNLTYTLTYTDDAWSFLDTVTDPRGNTTTYTYDYEDPNYSTSKGLLMKITYPEVMTDQGLDTPEVDLTYTTDNLLETITSPDGIVIKYDYWMDDNDPNSKFMVKKATIDYGTDPNCLNIEYNFTYDNGGRVVDVNDPFGNTTTLSYNVLDLLGQIEDPDGNITKLTYNADRKLTKLERSFNGGWQTLDYGYNIMAKLTTITDSLGKTTTLDYDDRYQVKDVTDSNDNVTQKRYNARQLVKEIIDAEDGSTTFNYDDNGRLSVVADAEDAETTYDYDGYGRLFCATYADDSNEVYVYDAASNLVAFKNRADETITFGYDALNRLVDKKVGTDPNIVLTYDIAGRLVEVSQSTDEMTFDYDRLGRLESTTDQNNKTVGSDYDAMGRRIKLTYPDDSYITYEYDASSRLEYIKDENGNTIAHYTYDDLSRPTDVDYYRGTSYVGSMDYDYQDANSLIDDDLGNRIERIDYTFNADSSHHISYTYDNGGNVTSTDVGGASGYYGWTYGYDKVYQVTDANQLLATNRQVDISYDAVYNRTSWTDSKINFTMGYTDNALNQYSQVTYNSTPVTPIYDDRGNCTYFGSGGTFSYDEENHLVSAGSVSYTYDLLGRRLSRSYGGVTTTYVWDGAHIIAEYTGGSLTKKYIYGPGMDNPVAMVDGETEDWYYYFTDALGSVRLLSDAGGSVVESYTYDPYGQPRVMASGGDGNWLTEDGTTYSSSSYGNPYMFTGRRWDSVTSLYYYRFRDYTPLLGRFLQTDPAKYIDTMNLYAYCGNNPVNFIDPWGLCGEKGARVGIRNLNGMKFKIVNSFLDFLNINLGHEQIFFSNHDTVGYFDDSEVRWGTEDIDDYELYDLVFVDEDILREAIGMVTEQWGDTAYDLLGTKEKKYNCQDFVKWVKIYYVRLGGRIFRNGKQIYP